MAKHEYAPSPSMVPEAIEKQGVSNTLRGCFVKTPYGWGICISDEPDAIHLQVALDWRLSDRRRVRCAVRRDDVSARSFCAAGDCVLTSYGTGVVIDFRPTDGIHCVQLWGPLGRGRNRAYLKSSALLKVLPAASGLAVETPYGNGICAGYKTSDGKGVGAHTDGHLIIDFPWSRAFLRPDVDIRCPVALALPLIDRFLLRAAHVCKLHSGTLTRLREALSGLGLERLQERLTATAGEAIEKASKLWEELESKDAKEVVDGLRGVADPKLASMLQTGIGRLNMLASKAKGFDGRWLGREDQQLRCTIKDAVIIWHWGQESELEIWANDQVSTQLDEDIFRATLTESGELHWKEDGDIWIREAGLVSTTEPLGEHQDAASASVINDDTVHSQAEHSLSNLRRIVQGDMLDGDFEEALEVLSNAAVGDGEIKRIVAEMRQRQQVLLDLRGQVLQSKTGQVLKDAHSRFSEHMSKLRENEISPQLDRIRSRSQRLVTRLATDKKFKNKAAELFTVAQNRIAERFDASNSQPRIEAWVSSVKDNLVGRLSVHRTMLVDCLGAHGGTLALKEIDFRQLIANSWDPSALEAQLQTSLVRAIRLSGMASTGTELLDRFESAACFAEIPFFQRTYKGLLATLTDSSIEVPLPIRKLLEAQAAGHSHDADTWRTAVVDSLDDETIVKGTADFVKRGEAVLEQFQGFQGNETVAKVMEHLESHDLERELVKKFNGFDAENMVNKAEGALTNADTREELVSQMKDGVLDFILKVLPAIRIEKLSGFDNGCDWEISDISFSDFSFRKENVHIHMGTPGVADEDLIRVSAWDISAHFRELKVSVKQKTFPFVHAEGIADAMAKRMSVTLAFRLQRNMQSSPMRSQQQTGQASSSSSKKQQLISDIGSTSQSAAVSENDFAPQLVVSSRKVLMENLELCLRESTYSVIVNALSYIFGDVLKDYACAKATKQLDKHTGKLVETLNQMLETSAPLLARLGWQLPAQQPRQLPSAASIAASVAALTVSAGEGSGQVQPEVDDWGEDDKLFLDWADPGRAFAVRV